MKYRIVIVNNNGEVKSGQNFKTREAVDNYILTEMESKEGVKHYRVKDKETGKLLETDLKRYDKESNENS